MPWQWQRRQQSRKNTHTHCIALIKKSDENERMTND